MREPFHIAQIVEELDRHDLLPCIVFRTARSQCDVDAERAGKNPRLRLSPVRQREIKERVHTLMDAYDMDRTLITTHPHYQSLITAGVGAHHAGQLLMWRLLLEELMAGGYLRALVATGTVAAGVDFPARTVVITAHSKRGSEGFRPLTSAEFQQMSGRAGRRGKDAVGFCVAAPSAFCDARALLRIARQPAEPLTSAYFPSPSTVLNLLRYRTVDGLRYTVQRSLAGFIDRRDAHEIRRQAIESANGLPTEIRAQIFEEKDEAQPEFRDAAPEEIGKLSKDEKRLLKRVRRFYREAGLLESRQIAMLDTALHGLRELGHVEGMILSEKGTWAANLCTNLVLELAEIIESGLIEGASAEMLAATLASISGDSYRNYLQAKNPIFAPEYSTALTAIIHRISSLNMPGSAPDRIVSQPAANTVLTWLQCTEWQEFRGLLVLSGVAEGDAARLITQTAEQLNQLTRLGETHRQLSFRAEEAKRRLLRPPLTEALNLDGL